MKCWKTFKQETGFFSGYISNCSSCFNHNCDDHSSTVGLLFGLFSLLFRWPVLASIIHVNGKCDLCHSVNFSVDTFRIRSPDVGKLKAIGVRHDNRWLGSSWYLHKVSSWQRWPYSTRVFVESDQVQISHASSPVVLHHTVWRTWLFIAYSDEKRL